MFSHPGASLSTLVAGEGVGDDKHVASGIVGFDVGKQRDGVGRVARSGTPSHLLAFAHTQRSIDPGLLRPAAVIQWSFNAVPCDRPTGRWKEGTGNDWLKYRRCRWSSTPGAVPWSGR